MHVDMPLIWCARLLRTMLFWIFCSTNSDLRLVLLALCCVCSIVDTDVTGMLIGSTSSASSCLECWHHFVVFAFFETLPSLKRRYCTSFPSRALGTCLLMKDVIT